MPSEGAVNPVL